MENESVLGVPEMAIRAHLADIMDLGLGNLLIGIVYKALTPLPSKTGM